MDNYKLQIAHKKGIPKLFFFSCSLNILITRIKQELMKFNK